MQPFLSKAKRQVLFLANLVPRTAIKPLDLQEKGFVQEEGARVIPPGLLNQFDLVRGSSRKLLPMADRHLT
jgi:hypothetical protein